MNKILMFAMILFCIAADAVGQNKADELDNDTYKPMLTEGRSWVVVTTTDFKDLYNFKDYETVKTVSRDTVIDGHSCKIIDDVRKDTGEKFKEILLEEDKVIYWYDEEAKEFLRWMDFNKQVGDDLYEGYECVISEDTVDVNGIAYRRLGIGVVDHEPTEYWVEGICASKWGLVDYPFVTTMGIYTYMKECYEDGKCIFTKDDFYKGTAGGVDIPSDSGVEDDTVYDLQGRRLRHTVPGINIVNGKKMLTR